MALIVFLQPRKVPDSTQGHTGSNSLVERVEQLLKRYESGQINPLDISTQIDSLIEVIFDLDENDLPLARKELCRLLQLNIEDVQLKLIRCLKQLFLLSILDYDVKNNQTNQLIDLEKQISDCNAPHLSSLMSRSKLAFERCIFLSSGFPFNFFLDLHWWFVT